MDPQPGFSTSSVGSTIQWQGAGRIWNDVIVRDARGAAFESLYVNIVMQAYFGERPMDIVEGQFPREEASFTNCWEVLDDVDLKRVFYSRFGVLQGCPVEFRASSHTHSPSGIGSTPFCQCGRDRTGEVGGWKLFLLIPFLLLRRPTAEGRIGNKELSIRFDRFSNGQWSILLSDSFKACQFDRQRIHRPNTAERRATAVCQKVRLGEEIRARQCLIGAALVPGNDQTFEELQSRHEQEVATLSQ